jgi:hypothetical protein
VVSRVVRGAWSGGIIRSGRFKRWYLEGGEDLASAAVVKVCGKLDSESDVMAGSG